MRVLLLLILAACTGTCGTDSTIVVDTGSIEAEYISNVKIAPGESVFSNTRD